MLHPGTLTKDFFFVFSFKKTYTFFLCHSVSYYLTSNLVNDPRNWILNSVYFANICYVSSISKMLGFTYLLLRV